VASDGGELHQRVAHLGRRLIAIARLLGHHLPADRDQLFRHIGPELPDRLRIDRLVLHQLLVQRTLGKRRAAGQQVVEGAAERVDVGPVVEAHPQGLLRRQIVDRTEDPLLASGLEVRAIGVFQP